MDDMEIRRRIDKYLMEICHFSQMQVFATSEYQKRYLQYQIDWVANELVDLYLVSRDSALQQSQAKPVLQQEAQLQTSQSKAGQQADQQQPARPGQTPIPQQQAEQPQLTQPQPTQPQPAQRVFTLEELTQNDGSGGKPAYVAISGKVYDVSSLVGWAGGTHFGLYAGHDLTSEFMGCHRGFQEVLKSVPVIGTLQK